MSTILFLVIVVVVTALVFDFTNGFHDSSNAMATSVATGAFTPRRAVLVAAVLNVIGACLSTEVSKTISHGMFDDTVIEAAPAMIFAGLAGAILWNLATWLFGLPSSSSHALFGGLVGATIVGLGFGGVNWVGDGTRLDGVVGKVILPALVSPVVAIIVSGVGTWLVFAVTRGMDEKHRERGFRWGQVGSASLISLAHGTNDAQKTMGVITLALIATGSWTQLHAVPFWVKVACALAIALGTYLGGWRIIRTLGKGLVEISSPQGMAADASSAAVILASSHMGFALSTTHVATGSILGSGLGRSGAKVNWRVAGRMLMSWAITLPAAALAGALMWLIGHLLGGLFGALVITAILLAAASWMYLHSRKSAIDHSNVNDDWVENVTAPRPLAAATEVADLIEIEQPEGSRA